MALEGHVCRVFIRGDGSSPNNSVPSVHIDRLRSRNDFPIRSRSSGLTSWVRRKKLDDFRRFFSLFFMTLLDETLATLLALDAEQLFVVMKWRNSNRYYFPPANLNQKKNWWWKTANVDRSFLPWLSSIGSSFVSSSEFSNRSENP